MRVWDRIRSTWAGSAAQPPAAPEVPPIPAKVAETLSVDPGAVQEPISHVAVTPVHWLPAGSSNAGCGADLSATSKWTIHLDGVSCVACIDAAALSHVAAAAAEPAPAIRKVHYVKDGTSACSTRPASPDHLTADPRLVTCKRCDRTLW